MAAVSLFWDTNMAAVTSCENTLYLILTNGTPFPYLIYNFAFLETAVNALSLRYE